MTASTPGSTWARASTTPSATIARATTKTHANAMPSVVTRELGLDPEQRGGGAAQHRDLVGIAETRRAQDMIDRRARPRERIVRAHDDLAGARLGRQVTQRLGREDDRVVVHLAHVLGRPLLQRPGLALREGRLHGVGPIHVRRKVATAVRRADLEPGELVERALEDQ